MSKKRFFSSTSIKKAASDIVALPAALLVYFGATTIYTTVVGIMIISVFLSHPAATAVAAESTDSAAQFLALVMRFVQLTIRIPLTDLALLQDLRAFTLDLIQTFPNIIHQFNMHLEGLDTMSEGYNLYYNFTVRFEAAEVQLRLFYRSLEALLGIEIQYTDLLPREYEPLYNDYIHALGGDPDTSSLDDMDID